jgi:hypothetical protein
MTPKEKAIEIVDSYFTIIDGLVEFKLVKECALIAVQELINFSSNQSLSIDFDSDYYCDYDFFIDVKKEIEAL